MEKELERFENNMEQINPKELRIGNLVEINGFDINPPHKKIVSHVPVLTIERNGVSISNETDLVKSYGMFWAIPLTEEWLLKFGFEFRECGQDINSGAYCHWDYWVKGDLVLRGNKNRFGFEGISRKGLNIKHIHQLQNLFYHLCGKELILKDNERSLEIS